MKKYFAALSATALISVAPFALAASSTELTVTGSITPSACTPILSNNGKVDIGIIPKSSLNPTQLTPLDPQDIALTVTCDSAKNFALRMIDNRHGTSAYARQYGLGTTPADQRLGSFNIQILSTTADSATARSIQSLNNAETWHGIGFAFPDALLSAAATGSVEPLAMQNLAMALRVHTVIAPANGLTLDEEVPIDGSATMELNYL